MNDAGNLTYVLSFNCDNYVDRYESKNNMKGWFKDLFIDDLVQKCCIDILVSYEDHGYFLNNVYVAAANLYLLNKGFLSHVTNIKMTINWKTDKDEPLPPFTFYLKLDSSNTKFTGSLKVPQDCVLTLIMKKIPPCITLTFKNNFIHPIAQYMKKLLESEEFSDVKVITKDRTFNVHKNILAMKSDVFYKMLNNEMLEKCSNEIKLLEWDSMVVYELLKYLYTEDCELKDVVCDLFKLAHFLQIQNLQDVCLSFIEKNVNESNILQICRVTLEDQYNSNNLMSVAEDFLMKNKIKLIENKQEIIEFFVYTINVKNVAFILRLADSLKNQELLQKTMDFVVDNKQVLELDSCKNLFKSNPELLLQIFKYSLDKKK